MELQLLPESGLHAVPPGKAGGMQKAGPQPEPQRSTHGCPRSALFESQDEIDGVGLALPLLQLRYQRPATRRGEGVVTGPPVVLRGIPGRANHPLPLQPVERGIERPLVELKDPPGALGEPVGDTPAVHRAEAEHLEHDHVERAGEEVVAVGRHGSPLDALKENSVAARGTAVPSPIDVLQGGRYSTSTGVEPLPPWRRPCPASSSSRAPSTSSSSRPSVSGPS